MADQEAKDRAWLAEVAKRGAEVTRSARPDLLAGKSFHVVPYVLKWVPPAVVHRDVKPADPVFVGPCSCGRDLAVSGFVGRSGPQCGCGQKLVAVDVLDALAKATADPEQCWHEATKDGTARCELPAGHEPTGRHVTRGGDVTWLDDHGCSGGTMGFRRCRCARCLYDRGEGPKPPPVLGATFATAKPAGISSGRPMLIRSPDITSGQVRRGMAEAAKAREDVERAEAPTAAPTCPYEAAAVARLNEAANMVPPVDGLPTTRAAATRRAREALAHKRQCIEWSRAMVAKCERDVANIEAALAEVGEPEAGK